MKNSYLLGVLVANLNNIVKVITNSRHEVFVTDLVIDNFRNTYDVMCQITDKRDDDAHITKRFYDDYFALKMDFYAQHKRTVDKQQYLTIIKQMLARTIDAAAKDGFFVEGYEPDAAPIQEPEPEAGAADERQAEQNNTPGDVQTPPTLSLADINKIVGLLEGITAQMNEILKIIKNGTKSNV